jgi:hypothetical protein
MAANDIKSARQTFKAAIAKATTEQELNAVLEAYDLALVNAILDQVKAATIAPLDVTVQHDGPRTGATTQATGKIS